jgi:hypothetical protein
MKNLLCMIIAVALLAGCSRPNQDAGTGSHEPVSGAFGWVFGSKLPDQYPVTPDDDGTFFYTYETNGFFQTISVNVDEQRQICMIRGFAPANSLGSFDLDNLVEELTKKYGLNDKDIKPFGRVWSFGKGTGTVHLSIINGLVTLLYRYDKLLDPAQQKFQEQKNKKLKDSLHGI